jgi:hypothetical protein
MNIHTSSRIRNNDLGIISVYLEITMNKYNYQFTLWPHFLSSYSALNNNPLLSSKMDLHLLALHEVVERKKDYNQ